MSNSAKHTELFKLHTTLIEKTIFMLLTASTASIGFILTQLKSVEWNGLILLPISAIVFLSISFISGCFALTLRAYSMKVSADYVSKWNTLSQLEYAEELKKLSKRVSLCNFGQYFGLFTGAIVYAVYVFLNIYTSSQVMT